MIRPIVLPDALTHQLFGRSPVVPATRSTQIAHVAYDKRFSSGVVVSSQIIAYRCGSPLSTHLLPEDSHERHSFCAPDETLYSDLSAVQGSCHICGGDAGLYELNHSECQHVGPSVMYSDRALMAVL